MDRKTRESLLHEVASLARLHGAGTDTARKIAHRTVTMISQAAKRQKHRPSVITEYDPYKRIIRFTFRNWVVEKTDETGTYWEQARPTREDAEAALDAFKAKRGLGDGYKIRSHKVGEAGGYVYIATSYTGMGTKAAQPLVLPEDPAAAIEMLMGQMSPEQLAVLQGDMVAARNNKR